MVVFVKTEYYEKDRRRRSLAELTANNEARDSTFQKEIDSIPEEQKKEFLCNLMVACTWVRFVLK